MSRALKRISPVHIAGFLSACLYAFLSYQSQSYAQATQYDLWVVCGLCCLITFLTFFYYHQKAINLPVGALLIWAFCFRLIGFTAFPVLEDDFYRYLWDGKMWVEFGSPYTFPPSDFFNSEALGARYEHILDNINFPEVATVYGPVCQFVFAVAYIISPGEVFPLQVFFGFIDFALIILLLKQAPARMVLLYAWCPLIIKEFAFTAHTDVLAVFFLFAAIRARQGSYFLLSSLLLAFGVGSKIFVLVLVPFLLGTHWRGWIVFFSAMLAISLPFVSIDPWLPGGLGMMAKEWLYNAPIHLILFKLLSPLWSKILLLLVFAIFWSTYLCKYDFQDKTRVPRGDVLFGFMLLCLPVANAWYVIWILPFAVLYPGRWPWMASVAALLCYANADNPDQALQTEVIVVEYCLIMVALMYDFLRPVNRERL